LIPETRNNIEFLFQVLPYKTRVARGATAKPHLKTSDPSAAKV